MEFEWIFLTIQFITARRQRPKVHEQNERPKSIPRRINFLSMINDIVWEMKDKQKHTANVSLVSAFAKRCAVGRWSFLGPGSEKN